MYLDFFNFRKNPFNITPDPEFLFLGPSHREALVSILSSIEQRKGLIEVIGEPGVGKTTILRSCVEGTDPEKIKFVYVFNADIPFDKLLKHIASELDIEVAGEAASELIGSLFRYLIHEYENLRKIALIIDEAQNMPAETLEWLQMLSDLETSQDKLLQIILVGQPELEQKLSLPELSQLRQQIAMRCRIDALTPEESLAYIRHRLMKASLSHDAVFTKGAMEFIIQESEGIPRLINILCDNVLINAFGCLRKPANSKIVREVIRDLRGRQLHFFRSKFVITSYALNNAVRFWRNRLNDKFFKIIPKFFRGIRSRYSIGKTFAVALLSNVRNMADGKTANGIITNYFKGIRLRSPFMLKFAAVLILIPFLVLSIIAALTNLNSSGKIQPVNKEVASEKESPDRTTAADIAIEHDSTKDQSSRSPVHPDENIHTAPDKIDEPLAASKPSFQTDVQSATQLISLAKTQFGNNPAQAEKLLEKAIDLEPANYEAYFQLGRLLTFKRDYSGAIREYKKALSINKQIPEIHFNLGYIYLQQRMYARSKDSYEKCLAASPQYKDEVLTNLGVLELRAGNRVRAMHLFQQAIRLNPENNLARRHLAKLR